MTDTSEPRHILAPHVLTRGEAMTVRVAYRSAGLRHPDAITTKRQATRLYLILFRFRRRMETEGLGADEHGRAMARGYAAHCQAVMFELWEQGLDEVILSLIKQTASE